MQTIFRADLRKLQSSVSCIPRTYSQAAVRAPVTPKGRRAEAIHAPRPPGTQNRRPGLATTHGVRARHDQLIRATGLHFLNLKFTRWHMLSVPTRRMAG